jgi:YVTN family beta-propeller protein
MNRYRFAAGFILLSAFLLPNSGSAAGSGYHLAATYKLPGEGGWDYLTLDPPTRRLFLSRSTHVIVINADTGQAVGEIPDTPGVHGIALAPSLGRGFVSNGGENTVSVFDLRDLKVAQKIKVGGGPDAILYDSSTGRVFTFNGRSHDTTAIDAAQGAVLGTLSLGGKPEFAVSDGKGEVFVNLEDTSELLALDPKKLEIKARWPLAPCEGPTGLALDASHHRLFVGCSNKLMAVVDALSGKVVTALPIGGGVDATAFDPETELAFASCGAGVLTVVREESPVKFSVVENVSTQRGARTMALDSSKHIVFLVTADFGPPAPSDQPHRYPTILPGTFRVLVLER